MNRQSKIGFSLLLAALGGLIAFAGLSAKVNVIGDDRVRCIDIVVEAAAVTKAVCISVGNVTCHGGILKRRTE